VQRILIVANQRRPHSLSEAQPIARKTIQQPFIAERVRALAVVNVTRREDLIITEEAIDAAIDLWVTLNLGDEEGQRKFGVALRGGWPGLPCPVIRRPQPVVESKSSEGIPMEGMQRGQSDGRNVC
jgi:hypothetical protein